MNKTIILVGSSREIAQILKYQIIELLGNIFNIVACSVDELPNMMLKADGIIISEDFLFEKVRMRFDESIEIITVLYTLDRQAFSKIKDKLHDDTWYIANIDYQEEIETIHLFRSLGLTNANFFPCHDEENHGRRNNVITPGELGSVPAEATVVIDVGDRKIDVITLFDLLNKFGMFDEQLFSKLIHYMQDTMQRISGILPYFEMISNMETNYVEIMDSIQAGLILFRDGIIQYINYSALKLLNLSAVDSAYVIGKRIESIFSDYCNNILEQNLISVAGTACSVISNFFNREKSTGILQLFTENFSKEIFNAFQKNISPPNSIAKYHFDDIIGNSSSIRESKNLAKIFANCDSPILIFGESGTGKEMFAQSIHNASLRKDGPFVAFNCAALTDSLVQSELFGYEKGAFTGADKNGKAGLIEYANHGTLFMDEIGELAPLTQAMLLRTIQEGEILRVGSTKTIPVDVRIIAATNCDLQEMMEEDTFRKDLFFRLSALYVSIPPLRERPNDIPKLIKSYFELHNVKLPIDLDVMKEISTYPWPGNVRELFNFLDYYTQIFYSELCEMEKYHLISKYFSRRGKTQNTPQQEVLISEEDLFWETLSTLSQCRSEHSSSGRGHILKLLQEKYPQLTENMVRKALTDLKDRGYIIPRSGCRGSSISADGMNALAQHIKTPSS